MGILGVGLFLVGFTTHCLLLVAADKVGCPISNRLSGLCWKGDIDKVQALASQKLVGILGVGFSW